mmetsp:Transcript_21570/g.45014  ORF Transcript_21570/g.45014 Transcript_21570/m.45014 type:complete len:386 (-) Transcript_21570:131-1288(-)
MYLNERIQSLLGSFHSSGLILSELHEGIVNLLDDFRSGISFTTATFVCNLFLDPEVGLLETISDFDGGFPTKLFHNELVVGVASTHTHGSVNVLDGQLLVFEGQGNVGEFNHIDHFGGSKVDGDGAVGKGEAQDTFDAIIDESEGTSLLAISPHFKVFGGSNGLSAESGRGLFASSLPGSTGSVNVVEASNADVQVEVTSVGQCHLFGVQLFQSVHILRSGRPGVGFDQTGVFGIFLLGFVVDAGTGGVEEVLDAVTSGTFQHVHGDGGVVEGQDRFVGDNETHTAHIGGQVVHLGAAFAGITGNFQFTQISEDEFITEFFILHELVLLPVDHNHVVSGSLHTTGNVASNETSATADANLLSLAGRQSKFRHCRHVDSGVVDDSF